MFSIVAVSMRESIYRLLPFFSIYDNFSRIILIESWVVLKGEGVFRTPFGVRNKVQLKFIYFFTGKLLFS